MPPEIDGHREIRSATISRSSFPLRSNEVDILQHGEVQFARRNGYGRASTGMFSCCAGERFFFVEASYTFQLYRSITASIAKYISFAPPAISTIKNLAEQEIYSNGPHGETTGTTLVAGM